MTDNINVVLMDFKTTKGNEMVSVNEDGSYTIFINSRLSYEGQLRAYKHAMKHIKENDFEKNDVQAIEAVAHSDKKVPDQTDAMPMSVKEYLDRLARLRREQRRLQKKIKEDEERVRFLIEHGDAFTLAERQYLYGYDLQR